MTASTRLRIALVGAGQRGKAHAATLAGLTDLYELAAVCDVDEARARALAGPADSAVYTDVADCFTREPLDACLIVTPPDAHHTVAQAAAEHGLHMLIETPLALTRAMMDCIAEVADKANVRVEVGENYGRRPLERLNQAAIAAGLIGKVVHLSALNAPANQDSCYHQMSLFRAYAGADVAEVHALGRQHQLDPARRPTEETWVDAVLTFENGVTASCSYVTSWTSPLRWGRPRITTVEGTSGYLVTADGGTNRLHRVEKGPVTDYAMQVDTRRIGDIAVPTVFRYDTDPAVEVASPFADRVLADAEPAGVADGLARAAELLSLHRAVTEGEPPEYGIARARRSQEMGIAIIESARLGQPVSARLGAETVWERRQNELLREPIR